MVARDIQIAYRTGGHLHVAHISTAAAIDLVAEARKRGIHVTSEVTPHHLTMADRDIPAADANYKMNPPLRSRADRDRCIEALADGTIDCIATDHAPHSHGRKEGSLETARFGVTGLETAFPVLYTQLVAKGKLTWERLVDSLTAAPARIFGFAPPTLAIGAIADAVIIDLDTEFRVTPEWFSSKSANSCFLGQMLTGAPSHTFVGGRLAWQG
jgi:dihydroorotase